MVAFRLVDLILKTKSQSDSPDIYIILFRIMFHMVTDQPSQHYCIIRSNAKVYP